MGALRGLTPRSLVGQVNFIAITPLPEMTWLADAARVKKSFDDFTAFRRNYRIVLLRGEEGSLRSWESGNPPNQGDNYAWQ
jgi:hypothetical protein